MTGLDSRKREEGQEILREILLDSQIESALKARARLAEAVAGDSVRMRRRVHERIKEESGMRRWSMRKMVVAAAAICVFGSMTAIAAGKIASVTSHSTHAEEITQYSQLTAMEEQIGVKTGVLQEFSNGFAFANAMPVYSQAEDEEGNAVMSGQGISLTYRKDGMADMNIFVEQAGMYEGNAADGAQQTFEHNGITLGYNEVHYRFVPGDYEVPEGEKKLVEQGDIVISYGSDQVEDRISKSIIWEQGDKVYSLMAFDSSMGAEEFYEMACEMMDGQQ